MVGANKHKNVIGLKIEKRFRDFPFGKNELLWFSDVHKCFNVKFIIHSFKIVLKQVKGWIEIEPLLFSTIDEQRTLLEKCRNADNDDGALEKDYDAESSSHGVRVRPSRSGELTGASELYTMKNK